MTERSVTVTTDDYGNVVEAKCSRCGYALPKSSSWHEEAVCVLVEAKLDPAAFVHQAAPHFPRPGIAALQEVPA